MQVSWLRLFVFSLLTAFFALLIKFSGVYALTNGVCGSAYNGDFTGANGWESNFNGELCDTGLPNDFDDNEDLNLFTWECNGFDGGTSVSCSANRVFPNDGVCGVNDGQTFSSSSFASNDGNQCDVGTYADFTYYEDGYWTWSCLGVYGGDDEVCNAEYSGTTGSSGGGTTIGGYDVIYHWNFESTTQDGTGGFLDVVHSARMRINYASIFYATGAQGAGYGGSQALAFSGNREVGVYSENLGAMSSGYYTIFYLENFGYNSRNQVGDANLGIGVGKINGGVNSIFEFNINNWGVDSKGGGGGFTGADLIGGATYPLRLHAISFGYNPDDGGFERLTNVTAYILSGGSLREHRARGNANNSLETAGTGNFVINLNSNWTYFAGIGGTYGANFYGVVDNLTIIKTSNLHEFSGALVGSDVIDSILDEEPLSGGTGSTPIAGYCGTAFDEYFTGTNGWESNLTGELCDSGTPSDFVYNTGLTLWTWTCNGIDAPSTECSAYALPYCGSLIDLGTIAHISASGALNNDGSLGLCERGYPSYTTYTPGLGWSWTCSDEINDEYFDSSCTVFELNGDTAICNPSLENTYIGVDLWDQIVNQPDGYGGCIGGAGGFGYHYSSGYYTYYNDQYTSFTGAFLPENVMYLTGFDPLYSGYLMWTCLGSGTMPDAFCSAYPADNVDLFVEYNPILPPEVLGVLENPFYKKMVDKLWFTPLLEAMRPYLDFAYVGETYFTIRLPHITTDFKFKTVPVNVDLLNLLDIQYAVTCANNICTVTYDSLGITNEYENTARRQFVSKFAPVFGGFLFVGAQLFFIAMLFLRPMRMFYNFLTKFGLYFILKYAEGGNESFFHLLIRLMWILPMLAAIASITVLFWGVLPDIYLLIKSVTFNIMYTVLQHGLFAEMGLFLATIAILSSAFIIVLTSFIIYSIVRVINALIPSVA